MIVPAMLPPSRFVDVPPGETRIRGETRIPGETPTDEREAPAGRATSALLSFAIKLSLAVGLVALGATQYLSRAVETGQRQREARAGQAEPETTGSIGPAAGRTILDPCTAAGLRR